MLGGWQCCEGQVEEKNATYQDGVIIKNKEITKKKMAIAEEEEELSKLKNEEKSLKELVTKLKGTTFFF
jgi:protein kinase C substrate 80K-H